ncbi:transcription regulator [Salinarchaeum sp. Harcht-Bsk1]|uniref:IclR family transcriptional regulator n=1 Tax=Salinarchaeum sp. Harcht-Bsk1 TaxID=1333523 RepID=UPI00034234C1|nr:IclR family transcriptional regulator [Salinarchaeum sp. Harcht-Bsk1]AGN01233.1 transcription regulator [Salinarchaeum sp. Harcht-Bsk1]
MHGRETDRVKAIGTALEILEILRDANGARVTEVADELGVSKSTVHDHLATLRERGFVERDGDRYVVGLRWLRFGGHARDDLELFQHGQIPATNLARETEELSVLSAFYGTNSVPVYQARGSKAVTTDSYPGLELPIHATATGKAMLANLSTETFEAVLDEIDLDRHAKNTIVDEDELREDVQRTRERGFSLDDEERIDGMRGIGAPITHEGSGEVLGALAMTGPTHRVRGERFREEYPQLVSNVAREIEINVTHQRAQHD